MENIREEHVMSFQSPLAGVAVPVLILTQSSPVGALEAQLVKVGTSASASAT